MKFFEFLTDRKGKFSLWKICFLLGTISFLGGWIAACVRSTTAVLPEMPSSVSVFLGVLGGTQLGKSWLVNKQEEANTPKRN
jgi:hypothetical protein